MTTERQNEANTDDYDDRRGVELPWDFEDTDGAAPSVPTSGNEDAPSDERDSSRSLGRRDVLRSLAAAGAALGLGGAERAAASDSQYPVLTLGRNATSNDINYGSPTVSETGPNWVRSSYSSIENQMAFAKTSSSGYMTNSVEAWIGYMFSTVGTPQTYDVRVVWEMFEQSFYSEIYGNGGTRATIDVVMYDYTQGDLLANNRVYDRAGALNNGYPEYEHWLGPMTREATIQATPLAPQRTYGVFLKVSSTATGWNETAVAHSHCEGYLSRVTFQLR